MIEYGARVRVAIVGEEDHLHVLSDALREAGIRAEALADSPCDQPVTSPRWFAQTLRRFGEHLEGDPPAAVLVTDASDASLAATLTATKLLIPVVVACDQQAPSEEPWVTNARMIGLIANRSVAGRDLAAIVEALRAEGDARPGRSETHRTYAPRP